MSLKEWNLDLEEKNFQLHAFILLFVHEHRVSLNLALAFPLELEFHSYVYFTGCNTWEVCISGLHLLPACKPSFSII